MYQPLCSGDDGENIYQMTTTPTYRYTDGKALFRNQYKPGITAPLLPRRKGITGMVSVNSGQYYMTAYADDNEGYFDHEKMVRRDGNLYQMPGLMACLQESAC